MPPPPLYNRVRRALTSPALLTVMMLLPTVAGLIGCDLVPRKPESVYLLYKERMSEGKPEDARKLLTEESQTLIKKIASAYRLDDAPEKVALLNIIHPASKPSVEKRGKGYVLLSVMTLKGRSRLIRMVPEGKEGHWKIDMSEELNILNEFLKAKKMLDSLRELGGEFAGPRKDMGNFLRQMRQHGTEGEPYQ